MCILIPMVFLITGCPKSSEWDQQWEHIQLRLQEGRLQEAKDLLQNILPSLRDNGPTDEHFGQVIYQLADIARLQGNLPQAESYYWEALPLFAESLGPEHVRMAEPLVELATLYEQKSQPLIALPLLKRALAIREKAWGSSNRQLLPTLKHYHVLLMLSDRHTEAVEILTRISQIEGRPS